LPHSSQPGTCALAAATCQKGDNQSVYYQAAHVL
jgi:hypothetical protein